MLIGDTRISKASHINWLKRFLNTYSPKCNDKYVMLDQGGELYGNPKVCKLFDKYRYSIQPTGANSSHQNGPVERNHFAIANHVRCLLDGANLDIKFRPYAFWHQLCILNNLVGSGQSQSPLQLALGQKENLQNCCTFGCCVWVRPSTYHKSKFWNNSQKGIFLGFVPNTTHNIIWYDVKTERVKIVSHAKFDEGMNDIPINKLPLNALHLQQSEFRKPIAPDPTNLNTTNSNSEYHPLIKSWPKLFSLLVTAPLLDLISIQTRSMDAPTFTISFHILPRIIVLERFLKTINKL